MKTVGDKILELREINGLSQEELGDEIDVSRQTISHWELNETSPSAKYMQKLCEFFKVDANYFLNDAEREYAVSNANENNRLPLCIKRLKIATIITGTLSAIFMLITIAIIIFATVNSGDYTHVSSTVSVHVSYEFYILLFTGVLLATSFIVLLILYISKRKK